MPRSKTNPLQNPESPSRQRLRASVDIFDDSIVVSRFDGEKITRRLVTPGQLIEAVGDLHQKVVQWFKLTDGVVAIGTDSSGRQRHLLVRPARKSRITFEVARKTFRMTVNIPSLLAEMVAVNSADGPRWVEIARVYAFAGRRPRADTILYVPPLPNVFAGCSICMGSVDIKRWSKLPAADAFEEAFIKSTFTDHLLDEPLKANSRYRNIIDAIRRTKGAVPFSALRKVGTYGQFYK